MRDEDTDETIRCNYCGSDGDCPHLLAVIDHTFLHCPGGYAFDRFAEFGEAIEAAFRKQLENGKEAQGKWSNEVLLELWGHAVEVYSKQKDLQLDGYILFRLIVDLLEEAGGERYPGPIDDGGGPGFASAITLFYAKAPERVFDLALSNLRNRLEMKGKKRQGKTKSKGGQDKRGPSR